MNKDHINEQYFGDSADPATERARERIHWICSQAEGRDILDIGCSQGIVCLILGREGFKCTGIDLETGSLAVANAALAKEDELVRARVSFKNGDASHLPFENESFDTVVLGELLEHLTHPRKVLAEARRVLRENGRIVVTVPFGLNAFPDHKATYYPISLLELLRPVFRLENAGALSSYLTFTGRRESVSNPVPQSVEQLSGDYLRLARLVEVRCLDKERSLLDLGKKLYAQIRLLNSQAKSQAVKLEKLDMKLMAKDAVIRERVNELESLRAALVESRDKLNQIEAARLQLRTDVAAADATRDFVQQELATARADNRALREEKERVACEATQLSVELSHLKVALSSTRKKCAQLQAANTRLRRQADVQQAIREQLKQEAERAKVAQSLVERELAAMKAGATAPDANACVVAPPDRGSANNATTPVAAPSPTVEELASALAETERLSRELAARDQEWQIKLNETEQELKAQLQNRERALEDREKQHAIRLRERERHLMELAGEREAKWKRSAIAERIRSMVRAAIPLDSRVLVISKGDDELLQLDGRRGEHFPQTSNGLYAGYHPATSAEALEHLEGLRAGGAEYLLIPETSLWWLDFYSEFGHQLTQTARVVLYEEGVGVIYALSPVSTDRSNNFGLVMKNGKPGTLLDPAERAKVENVEAVAIPNRSNGNGNGNGNGSGVGVKLGVILDEFTMDCLKPEGSLVTFRPDNWQERLEQECPDALFVESAWRGNEGAWLYRIANYQRNMGDEIVELLDWARQRGIPSIFWNKEDPVHYERFIGRARLFSHVFTSDADCIPRYLEAVGHDRVYALPFAAQPSIHHPVRSSPRDAAVCFAGTYYGGRHTERREDMEYILRPAIPFGLEIYDRQHGVTGKAAEEYRFPDIYQACIRGRLDYEEMVKAYKRYRVFLNVNSVKQSPTMFSRRVFELLASGTPVISTYSRGIVDLLGEDVVYITESEADTRRHLERLLGSDDEWAKASLRGIRKVMGKHTYRHRLREVAMHAGIRVPRIVMPRISVVVKLSGPDNLECLSAILQAQIHQPVDVVLIGEQVMRTSLLDPLRNALPDVRVVEIPGSVENLFQHCRDVASGNFLAFLDLRDAYGPNYLMDYAHATLYSDADYFGKHTFFRATETGGWELHQSQHEYVPVTSVPSSTLMARKSALTGVIFEQAIRRRHCGLAGHRTISIDRFNFILDAARAGGWQRAGASVPGGSNEVYA